MSRRVPAILLLASLLALPCLAQEEKKSQSVEELTAQALGSLVVISQTGRDGNHRSVGSGFVISEDGLIATCNHVIGQSRELKVRFEDGREFEVTAIHAWDRKLDLAILRIDPGDKKLPALELGNSDKLATGQRVVTIGNPHGLSFSVVEGIVSAIREVDDSDNKMIQVAIPVEPGNSGGPLIDLHGKVFGIVTMKSTVSDNIGFVTPINALLPLLEKPNSVPMKNWVTIGALNPRQWKVSMGAKWRQRAGKITVETPGKGFGGRSLCLSQLEIPPTPYDLEVTVRLDAESGAAGLAFESDDGEIHYGFYPSAGQIRFTRFDGADVYSWNVLQQLTTDAYHPGEWNHLRVRVGTETITGFVNGQQVFQMPEKKLRGGKAGLVKFRQTRAEFKNFNIGKDLSPTKPDPELVKKLRASLENLAPSPEQLNQLATTPKAAQQLLETRRKKLTTELSKLEALEDTIHLKSIAKELVVELDEAEKADLAKAALLIAKLDNPELDIPTYLAEIERLSEAATSEHKTDRQKLAALSDFLFQQNGFHGSRDEPSDRANSYLNEVIDDREGIPITLAILYLEIAEHQGIKNLEALAFPSHFLLRHSSGKNDQQYIDPFDGGKFITEKEAAKLAGLIPALGEDVDQYSPSNKRQIIFQLLGNLQTIAMETEKSAEMLRYAELLVATNPEQADARLGRALLLAQTDQPERAIPDLDWIFKKEPDGIDLDRLRPLYEHLKSKTQEP